MTRGRDCRLGSGGPSKAPPRRPPSIIYTQRSRCSGRTPPIHESHLTPANNKVLSHMPAWSASNVGQWLDLSDASNIISVDEPLPGDRYTLTGGLLILGYAHGVSARIAWCPRPCHC